MKNRIALLLVAAVLLAMTLSACGSVKDVAAVNDLGKSFMITMRDGDISSAWNMMTSSLQNEIGDINSWKESATPRNFSDWDFTNTQIQNKIAQMDGEATLGENKYTILLFFDKADDGSWKISGINFTLKE
jgi:hypothetical protein